MNKFLIMLKWFAFSLLLVAGLWSVNYLWTYYQTHFKGNQASLSFVVVGDNEGVNPTFEKILGLAEQQKIDVLVDVADLTSAGEKADMQLVLDRLAQEPYRTEVVVGNNDLGPSNKPDNTNFKELVRNPTYSSFDLAGAHFVLLDNANRRVGFSDEELVWLEADLKTNTQAHTFLFMHRPLDTPFQNLVGNDETSASKKSNQQFISLVQQFHIDQVFTGHLETFIQYDDQGIPFTVTGGAHDRPDQTGFGVSLPSTPHYTLVTVTDGHVDIEKILIQQ